MKKKRDYVWPRCWNSWQKMLIFKKILVILFWGAYISIPANPTKNKGYPQFERSHIERSNHGNEKANEL